MSLKNEANKEAKSVRRMVNKSTDNLIYKFDKDISEGRTGLTGREAYITIEIKVFNARMPKDVLKPKVWVELGKRNFDVDTEYSGYGGGCVRIELTKTLEL